MVKIVLLRLFGLLSIFVGVTHFIHPEFFNRYRWLSGFWLNLKGALGGGMWVVIGLSCLLYKAKRTGRF